MRFGGIHNNIGSQVDQLENKFVRMQSLDFVLLKNFARKVLQIHRDDHLSVALSIRCRVRSSFSRVRSGLFFSRFEIHSS